MKKETGEFISNAIIGEIATDKTIDTLLSQIRAGHARYINQEAWDVVASFLETKLYGRRKTKEVDLWLRDKIVGDEFIKLIQEGVPQKIAYGNLADKHGLSEPLVKAIANKARKQNKLILESQNRLDKLLSE